MVTIHCAIFDLGGVITKPQAERYVDRMVRLLGIEKDGFAREYRKNRPDYDRGTVDGRGYWGRIASAFDREIGDETVGALIEYDVKSWTVINQDMKRFIRQLQRNGVKTAVLSNINFDTIRHLEAHQKWISRLGHRIFSCELHMMKPEKAIYEKCLSEVGCAPEECLFIDDVRPNVQAADALGIHTILFEDSGKMMDEIGSNYRFEA